MTFIDFLGWYWTCGIAFGLIFSWIVHTSRDIDVAKRRINAITVWWVIVFWPVMLVAGLLIAIGVPLIVDKKR